MKLKCTLLSFVFLFLASLQGHSQKFVWGKAFLATGENGAQNSSIATGKNCEFIGGYYDTQIDVGGTILKAHSDLDGFLAKLDTSGAVLWARTLGAARSGYIFSVEADVDGNFYAAGEFSDSLFLKTDTLVSDKIFNGIVEKYDSIGNLTWIKLFPDRRVWRLTTNQQGDLFLMGDDFTQPGSLMSWIAKYDKYGNQIYDRILTNDGFIPANFAVDAKGNTYISGLAGYQVQVGNIEYTGSMDGSFIIVKCNAAGNPIRVMQVENIPASGAWYTSSIAVDGLGNIYHNTYQDMLSLSKRDSDGNILWSLRDDTKNIGMKTLMIDDRGGLLVSGRFVGTFSLGSVNFSSPSQSMFIASFTANGQCKWLLNGNNENFDYAFDAARSRQTGDLYTAGYLYSKSPTFGEITLTDPGLSGRAFVLKVDIDPSYRRLSLDLGDDFYLCTGESVDYKLKGFASYEWQDGSTDSTMQVINTGEYYVKAVDWTGYVYRDTVQARECFEPIIPNVITPNGDAYNQLFVVQGLDLSLSNPLIILNRWGERVFETTAYENNWAADGLNTGIYFYELQSASTKRTYRGWVQVLR